MLTHIGNYTIQFSFEFDGKMFYFSRDTENYNRVNRCVDNSNEQQDDISVDDYCKFLMDKYGIDLPGLSFRAIVSGYARIYHRENYNENRPLEIYCGEAAEKGSIDC